jgi:DNA polymerase-3 subunit delta'
VLGAAFTKHSMGHAYLFSGQAGSGMFAAALDLALILHCSDDAKKPCMRCAACKKILHYSYPDFHVIMPVVLGKEHKSDGGELTSEGWEYIAACVKERIIDPYGMLDHAKMPTLPVDWIREVNHTLRRGPVESAANVVIIDGIDMMNKEAANSMLKLLEEPPPGTVMVLLTERLSAVLPTITSRCQIMRFALLDPHEIKTQLCQRLSIDTADSRLESVINAGTFGTALSLWRNPPDAIAAEAVRFWDLCVQGEWGTIASFIDEAAQWADVSRYERMFIEIMERVRNTFLSELPGSENVFLGERSRIIRGMGVLTGQQLDQTIDLCQKAIDAIKAHAAVTLVLAHFAIALSKEFHGKKRQTS